MADPVFTLSKVKQRALGGIEILVADFTSDGGTYAAGGFVFDQPLAGFSKLNREPDIVIVQSNLTANGYRYDYDQTTKKLVIRVATTAGTNAIEAEHTAAAVVAAARTGARLIAIWLAS